MKAVSKVLCIPVHVYLDSNRTRERKQQTAGLYAVTFVMMLIFGSILPQKQSDQLFIYTGVFGAFLFVLYTIAANGWQIGYMRREERLNVGQMWFYRVCLFFAVVHAWEAIGMVIRLLAHLMHLV